MKKSTGLAIASCILALVYAIQGYGRAKFGGVFDALPTFALIWLLGAWAADADTADADTAEMVEAQNKELADKTNSSKKVD